MRTGAGDNLVKRVADAASIKRNFNIVRTVEPDPAVHCAQALRMLPTYLAASAAALDELQKILPYGGLTPRLLHELPQLHGNEAA